MKNCHRSILWFAVLLLACAFTPNAFADEAKVGRDLIAKHGSAVVTVRSVIEFKMSFMGEDRTNEEDQEETGTVIDPSGLTVVALVSVDPGDFLGDLLAKFMGSTGSLNTKLKDLRIVLGDGKEIPCEVVLRDKDLGVAFIRPVQKPTEPMAYVDLSNSTKVEMLDQILVLTRLGKAADRSSAIATKRINAVIEKPRNLYASNLDFPGSVFSGADGKIVGIIAIRTVSTQNMGEGELPFLTVVVPAEDIILSAKEVL